jgi:glycosyltransferase involved in cell wall biosynthesis
VSDLLVTTHTPILRSGQTMRTYGIARALAAADGLTLLYARFEGDRPDHAFSSIPGIELREALPSRGARRLLAYAGARLRRVPEGFARGISPELADQAERLAAAPGRGRVIADGPIAAAALAGLARRRPVLYNAHNLESSFRHELSSERAGTAGLRRFERGLLARAAESWMVSPRDMAAAAELCPQAKLRYVPNVVDVSAIVPVVAPAPGQNAIFVANFAYEPNRNGLRFLLEEVFPLVWERLPDARLTLVGGGLEQAPSDDPRVHAAGFVDDLRDAYASARCALVPLLQGGGTPLKFVEALAYGLPVLATSRAAAGLSVSDGVDCLLADSAAEFAVKLVAVLRDGGAALGAQGRRLALERYSIEALTQLLD